MSTLSMEESLSAASWKASGGSLLRARASYLQYYFIPSMLISIRCPFLTGMIGLMTSYIILRSIYKWTALLSSIQGHPNLPFITIEQDFVDSAMRVILISGSSPPSPSQPSSLPSILSLALSVSFSEFRLSRSCDLGVRHIRVDRQPYRLSVDYIGHLANHYGEYITPACHTACVRPMMKQE